MLKTPNMAATMLGRAIAQRAKAAPAARLANVLGRARMVAGSAGTSRVAAIRRAAMAPAKTRPLVAGMMPRKVFVNPKMAVPARKRGAGPAPFVNVFDRLTRGRVAQRGTR